VAAPRARVVLVVLVSVGLLAAWQSGALSFLAEPATLATSIREMGVRGYVGFVLAYAVLQPFGVPGTLFIVAAPLLWPWPVAFALSMAGTMAASVVGFSFARFVARDWLTPRIPARLRAYDEALARDGFQTVALLRLLLWMPPLLHAFFGVSRVPFGTHFWGSLLGYTPTLFAISYFGSAIFDVHGQMHPGAWRILVGMTAFSVTVALLARAWDRRRAARR
jgi:uncharacterized membrane protein YdjX (TVP38/TMEM64 family)